MRPRFSLSTKVFLTAFLNLALLVLAFLVFMRVQLRLDFESFLRSPAQDRILAVGRQVALDLRDLDVPEWNRTLERYSKEHKVEMFLVDGRVRQLAGPNRPLPSQVVEGLHESLHGRRGRDLIALVSTSNPSLNWAAMRVPVPDADAHRPIQGALVIASPSSLRGSLFSFDPAPWLAIAGAAVFLSVLCWLPLVRGLTRSIALASRATAQIEDGHFEVHLPVRRRDELGQLGQSINRMAARLAVLIGGQKRFLGDVAHELCSPLARMQVAIGTLERTAAAGEKECVADLKDDAQLMSALVNDLLSFSRAGLRSADAPLEPVHVGEIVAAVLSQEKTPPAGVVVTVEEGLRVLASRDLLVRALANLVRNAVRYAGEAGPIEITAAREGAGAMIRVADRGPGLAEQDLEAVFQPFYRPASARERETGGVGLGLAIVRNSMESCQGSVRCRNRAPSGLEVELRLKLA
jgi:two-component system sensor histidine kinase CpxA